MHKPLSILAGLCAMAISGVASADDAIATYAIVVGSNVGGPGQQTLKYAEDDARRVGQLLTELGGYQADQVDVVAHPSPEQLRAHINKLADKINADLAAGKQSRVLFYYSGHARAAALDLGTEEMPLVELRQRLFQLPAKLTVVVLDACQSGAFSRVKGAEPAADFSFNSRQQLDASGVAVLASSSGSELSQESETLKSSYFTHHLLVGLRGASDTNKDGLVTIDEAYRYAYHQTLLATAETAVGGQHVSLEVDLKGHGEVPLAYPRAATAHIELPAALEGKTLVEDTKAKVVVAETYKAKGAAVRIAVAPGSYRVIVRKGTTLSRCDVSSGGTVDLSRCTSESLDEARTKGGDGGDGKETFARPWRIEAGGSIGPERHDAYTDNLDAFGYDEQDFLNPSTSIDITGLKRYSKRLYIGATGGLTTLTNWTQHVSGSEFTQHFDWNMLRVAATGRAEQPFAESGFLSRISMYGQLTLGLGIGRTSLEDAQKMTHTDMHVGPAFAVGAGLHVESPIFTGLGLTTGWAYDYAPVIRDLIGNTHGVGGHRINAALTYSF